MVSYEADKPRDECGIFGIFSHHDSAAHAALGLHSLQHRGQEATGIVTHDGRQFHAHRGLGQVGENFGSQDVIDSLRGTSAIGHVRYSTSGETILRNVQPLFADLAFGGFTVAHNGNLTNGYSLRQELVNQGCIFHTTMDTEVIIHLVATSSQKTVIDRMVEALYQCVGAYSLIAMTEDLLIGVRDPLGVRPLVLGILDGAYVLASETCALDIIGASYMRDIEPGEMAVISSSGVKSINPFAPEKSRFCIFEYIYFARPDSAINGIGVYNARKRIGAELAREAPVEADVVVPVPDSGVPAAIGFASESKIAFELGIIRNHYVGRTFIEPSQQIRHLGVRLKHSANRSELKGKRVILVDDSIVRGTTSTKIVEMVRDAGASQVHMRIASPPTEYSCFYGVDTPHRDELLAANLDLEQMKRAIGVDSLAYISMDGLYRAMTGHNRSSTEPQYCDACFSGDYPIELADNDSGNLPAQLSLLAEQR